MFAFVAPTPLLSVAPFAGSPLTAPRAAPAPAVRASLAENVARRARQDAARVGGVALGALAAAALVGTAVPSAQALTKSDIDQLTYSEVKGTGVANRCPEVVGGKGTITLDSGKQYRLADLCMEPKSFQVEEEKTSKKGDVKKEFVDTKLMTRATYTLTGIEGPLVSDGSSVTFTEKDGIDYAATTVQLPGGERVPFLFTVKSLVAKAAGGNITTASEFGGEFTVPSYRSGLFLDPKGRGGVTGYDMAVGLPAMEADGGEGQQELAKETNKVFEVLTGALEMAVQRIDPETGEIAGVFVSEQPSDTDSTLPCRRRRGIGRPRPLHQRLTDVALRPPPIFLCLQWAARYPRRFC
jgi:photosystem II oxygen-evolving enhancer protein 1